MSFIHKYICGILFILLLGYFFLTKDLNNKYDKVVMAEGHGYYVYLPALFIYHDNTFEFFNQVYPKYYYPGFNPPTRNFINEFEGIRVNKYYPGVSLLWMPFFLLAHLLALLFHLPADGYSDIYQYAIGVAGVFYTYLGLKFVKKILGHFNIPSLVQVATLSIIIFGTNMLLYSSAWSSQTHSYSFFAIAAFFWFVIRLFDPEYERKNFALAMCFIFLALIVTLRPQNVGILLLLPVFGLTKDKILSLLKKNLFSVAGIAGMVIGFLLVGRVCYYWYIQTGKIFLNPYHGEHYYFNQPHFFAVLFGYRQGWIVYSPFILFGLAGIFFFPGLRNKINLLLFWILFIYVSSCWWCWTYGSTSFGQRIYVDFYCIIALQAALLFKYFYERRAKKLSVAVATCVIPLAVLQTHQYKHGIIPGEYGNAETYWGNFFVTGPISFYPVPKSSILDKEEHFFSFDDYYDSLRTEKAAYSGRISSFVSSSHSVNEKKYLRLPSYMSPGDNSIVRFTAMIRSSEGTGNPTANVDFIKDGKVIAASPFYMQSCLKKDKWVKYQYGQPIPDGVAAGDTVSIYFQQAEGSDTTFIDDLKIELIHTDHSYEFKM